MSAASTSGPDVSMRWLVGAICVAMGAGYVAWLELHAAPGAQRFVLVNAFEPMKCVMTFLDGTHVRFSVQKDARHTRRFSSPRTGFVDLRCQAESRNIDAPGHFHLVKGGVSALSFSPYGEIEVRYHRSLRRFPDPGQELIAVE